MDLVLVLVGERLTCTSSCSSLLTSSRPPMSSQLMLGTSTTVSLRAEGLLWLSAHCRHRSQC